MVLFGGIISIKAISFLMLSVFAVTLLGYALGRIKIKGIDLGTAGVFVIALVYGCLFYNKLGEQLVMGEHTYVTNALKIIENIGLILFVTSVGFIAGPNFFHNFKRNYKSYVLLGVIIILSGSLACAAFTMLGGGASGIAQEEFAALMSGILSGALTSTPAFSAAKATVANEHLESLVSVGYGIAYLFGVVGVVLFVQIMPKLCKADMEKERTLISGKDESRENNQAGLVRLESFGIAPFALAAVIGIFIGSVKVGIFSLTTTGGCLLTAIVMGHFGHIGRLSVMPSKSTLNIFREFGLVLFLIGAGVSGGANFVKYFQPVFFLYGVVITLVPMIVGFIAATKFMKLSLLNALGSITGGMTSTPALGTLIDISGTENVANAYAATYPIALISVVITSQLIITLLS